jgi:hypothetical protein
MAHKRTKQARTAQNDWPEGHAEAFALYIIEKQA